MTARRSAILTYHSLDETGSVISVSPLRFRQHMEFLAEGRIPVVPLEEALRQPGSVAITFDDGFRNFAEFAVPELARHSFPATVFVVSEFCGGKNDWPGQPKGAVPELPLMSWDDLASLPDFVSIGAHTATHPDLSKLPLNQCEAELRGCCDRIEQRLGRTARSLAYPYGAVNAAVCSVAARYFDLAVSTSLKFVPAEPDRLNLPRIDAYYLRGCFSIDRLFTRSGGYYIGLRNWLRSLR